MKKRLIIIALALTMLCAAVPAGINAFAAGDVTRAEWVSQLVAAFDMTVENDDNMPDNYFSDISEDMPYYHDILLAVEFGVINIEAGEPFRPDEPATREFAAQTLNSCLLFQLDEGEGYTFAESGSVTYPDDIQVAINRGWFKLSGNNFMPDQAVTTAEMTAMLNDAKAVLASEVIDENHQNTFEFAPGVIEIPATANTSITADNTVTITDYDPQIKAGDIFVVYTGDLPVALKATNVTTDGNTTIISAASEGADGAIVSGDAEGVIGLDLENFEFDETETYSVVDTSQANAAAEEFTVEAAGISWDKKTETLTGSKKIKLGGSTVGSITFVMKGMHLEFKASIGEIVIVSDDTKITTNIKVDLGDYAGIPKSLVLGNINIGGVGNISLSMEYNIEGELTYNWNGSTRTGFSFEDGYFRVIADFYKKNADLNGSAELKAGLRLSASVKSWFGSGGIYASIGVKMRAEFHSYDSGSPQLCVTTKGYMYAEVGASATLFGQKCGPKTKEIYNEYNSPIRVVYHYEDGKLVTSCARGLDLKYTTSPWSKYFNPYYGQGSYGGGGTAEPIIIWEYKVENDGNATITKFRGNASAVSIPETIDGYTVTKIGRYAFENCKEICSVSMSNNIVEIDECAFKNCINLSNISLSNVKTLGGNVFENCASLTDVEIPKTLENTQYYYGGGGPFYNSGLKNAMFEEGSTLVPPYTFCGADKLENVTLLDTITSIGWSAFSDCISLKDIALPNSITKIDSYAFSDCTALNNIKLPEYLMSIGNSAFSNCQNFTKINIPDSVVEIDERAFKDCINLSNISLSNVETLGGNVFENCASLTDVEIPKTLENTQYYYGGGGPFYNSGLKNAMFEEGSTLVPPYTFCGADKLENVTLLDTITSIGWSAFSDCISLKDIALPNSITKIDSYAFACV